MWYCCGTSGYEFLRPLGDNGKSHSAVNGHLTEKHDIVGQQPGTPCPFLCILYVCLSGLFCV